MYIDDLNLIKIIVDMVFPSRLIWSSMSDQLELLSMLGLFQGCRCLTIWLKCRILICYRKCRIHRICILFEHDSLIQKYLRFWSSIHGLFQVLYLRHLNLWSSWHSLFSSKRLLVLDSFLKASIKVEVPYFCPISRWS